MLPRASRQVGARAGHLESEIVSVQARCSQESSHFQGVENVKTPEKEEPMKVFTTEAAEQIISLLCYSRTEDTYNCSFHRGSVFGDGAFRLAVTANQHADRLVLSDKYDSAYYQTITVEAAIQKGLLEPSWEDLAAKLYLNDQDILQMCLMSHEEPVCLRLIEIERIRAYRDQHNDKAKAKKFTYMPNRLNKHMRLIPGKAKFKPGRPDPIGAVRSQGKKLMRPNDSNTEAALRAYLGI